jgi:hypothetical protein
MLELSHRMIESTLRFGGAILSRMVIALLVVLAIGPTCSSGQNASATDSGPDATTDADSDGDSDSDTDVDTEVDAGDDPDGGEILWARRAGGIGGDEGLDITAMPDGSMVVVGWFGEVATFGPDEPGETELTSAGDLDVFIARYSSDGSLIWAKRAGGVEFDEGAGVSALPDGSVVVTGYFGDAATFGPGEDNETTLVSAGGWDVFLCRLSPDGTLDWAKRVGGNANDTGFAVAALPDGSSMVTGNHWSDLVVFGEGEENETLLLLDGSTDAFLAKYNADGSLAWAEGAGGSDVSTGRSISLLADGSAILTGYYSAMVSFGHYSEDYQALFSAGLVDVFLAKYSSDGMLAWAKSAGGNNDDFGVAVSAFPDGSSVLVGYFGGSCTFGPGELNETEISTGSVDVFIAKHDSDGDLLWVNHVGGTSHDYAGGLATLPDGSAVLVASIYDAVGRDLVVAKYGADGAPAWSRVVQKSHLVDPPEIVVSDDTAVLTGAFWGTAVFGLDDMNETTLESAGGVDVFVAKITL